MASIGIINVMKIYITRLKVNQKLNTKLRCNIQVNCSISNHLPLILRCNSTCAPTHLWVVPIEVSLLGVTEEYAVYTTLKGAPKITTITNR